MKELLDNEPLAVILLISCIAVLALAFINRRNTPSVKDDYFHLIDWAWQPTTVEETWLWQSGYEKMKNDSFFVRVIGVYGEQGKYEVYYHTVHRNFYTVANAKLELMQRFKCSDYDAEADFHTLVVNRLKNADKEVENE